LLGAGPAVVSAAGSNEWIDLYFCAPSGFGLKAATTYRVGVIVQTPIFSYAFQNLFSAMLFRTLLPLLDADFNLHLWLQLYYNTSSTRESTAFSSSGNFYGVEPIVDPPSGFGNE